MRMTKVREIAVSGFSADPNPNTTAPAAGTTFVVDNSPGDQEMDERVEGHRLCIRFVDNSNVEVPGATADFQTWAKDDGATAALGRSAWVSLRKESAAPSSQAYASPLKAELFVQVTAISASTATKVQIWAETSTSVPG